MKVRVKTTMPEHFYGFYGEKRRYPGDEFEIEEDKFSDNWMEKLSVPKKPGPKPKVSGGE